MDETEIRRGVRDHYAKLAQRRQSCCDTDSNKNIYTKEQLSEVPSEASEISAGCCNPILLADIKEGETVLDLGSGGGIDVFLAASAVGPSGKAIGVDATPEMIWRAREISEKNNIENVEFLLGEIEHLPLEKESVDLVISNCVINLSPDKRKVFEEAFRVLKPGGRLGVSDIVLLEELPEEVKKHLPYCGCVAGALLENEYLDSIRQAGFENVKIVERYIYPNMRIASLTIIATKP